MSKLRSDEAGNLPAGTPIFAGSHHDDHDSSTRFLNPEFRMLTPGAITTNNKCDPRHRELHRHQRSSTDKRSGWLYVEAARYQICRVEVQEATERPRNEYHLATKNNIVETVSLLLLPRQKLKYEFEKICCTNMLSTSFENINIQLFAVIPSETLGRPMIALTSI